MAMRAVPFGYPQAAVARRPERGGVVTRAVRPVWLGANGITHCLSVAALIVLLGAAGTSRILDSGMSSADAPESSRMVVRPDGTSISAVSYFREPRPAIEARLGAPVRNPSRHQGRWVEYRTCSAVVRVRYSANNVADHVMVIGHDTDTRVDMMPRPPTYSR